MNFVIFGSSLTGIQTEITARKLGSQSFNGTLKEFYRKINGESAFCLLSLGFDLTNIWLHEFLH